MSPVPVTIPLSSMVHHVMMGYTVLTKVNAWEGYVMLPLKIVTMGYSV